MIKRSLLNSKATLILLINTISNVRFCFAKDILSLLTQLTRESLLAQANHLDDKNPVSRMVYGLILGHADSWLFPAVPFMFV